MLPIGRRQEGNHVVVTGAGTGIGRAIALRLAAEGAALSLLARDAGRLEETAELARGEHGAAVHVGACDIREADSVERAFDVALEAHGPLAALVANSGIGGPNAPGEGDRFLDLIETNVNGTYRCLRAAQGRLAEGNGGARHLVVISSILARIGVPGYSGYCASKAALLGLVRSLAAELAPHEVQVNAVCPGWVDTQMAREGLEGMAQAMGITFDAAHALAMQQVPLGRMGQPADVAGLVAWLLTDDARGVTGQALDMNGGAFMI
jgi:NAD(P)-dependent dehydrogenase (short-subunit alcohol dehydrogenase family)